MRDKDMSFKSRPLLGVQNERQAVVGGFDARFSASKKTPADTRTQHIRTAADDRAAIGLPLGRSVRQSQRWRSACRWMLGAAAAAVRAAIVATGGFFCIVGRGICHLTEKSLRTHMKNVHKASSLQYTDSVPNDQAKTTWWQEGAQGAIASRSHHRPTDRDESGSFVSKQCTLQSGHTIKASPPASLANRLIRTWSSNTSNIPSCCNRLLKKIPLHTLACCRFLTDIDRYLQVCTAG